MTNPIVKELTRTERDLIYKVLLLQKQEMEQVLKDQIEAGNKDMTVYYTKRLSEIQEALNLF